MKFYGQEPILRELEYLIPELKEGLNTNILLVAPSGYGKTTLAYMIMSRLGWEDVQISGPPNFYFDTDKRVHFLDEVHELRSPEALYEHMSNDRHIIILATNEMGLLKEPLINRCTYQFVFDVYNNQDLFDMATNLLTYQGFGNIPREYVDFVVRMSNGVPRVLRNMVQRLCVVFKRIVPESVEQLSIIVRDVLNIDEQGYGPDERAYLNFLYESGPASLGLISAATGIDRNTIMKHIEPNLVKRGVIRISNRGRDVVL